MSWIPNRAGHLELKLGQGKLFSNTFMHFVDAQTNRKLNSVAFGEDSIIPAEWEVTETSSEENENYIYMYACEHPVHM